MDNFEKFCFFVSPIGEKGSPERIRSDQLLTEIIVPVVNRLGYDVRRGDQDNRTGLITNHIVQDILDCDLALVDITGQNPNVFYELALCHAARKQTIILQDEDEKKIPFDMIGQRVFPYRLEAESANLIRQNLERTIKDNQSNFVDNPVLTALRIEYFTRSTDVEDKQYGEILSILARLQEDVNRANNLSRIYPTIGAGQQPYTGSAVTTRETDLYSSQSNWQVMPYEPKIGNDTTD